MGLVNFDDLDADNPVTPKHPTRQRQVLRGEEVELIKFSFEQGFGAEIHQHPEEQVVYILEGVMEFTVDGETYDAYTGQASYHAPNVPHGNVAKTDVVGLSFKKLVAPAHEWTGKLRPASSSDPELARVQRPAHWSRPLTCCLSHDVAPGLRQT